MKTELISLVWVTVLTAVLWIPYILNRLQVRGLKNTMGYPFNPISQAPWASRLQAAHLNAVENLVVFGILVLVAHALGISNEATIMAGCVFFWARLVHAAAYTFAIPWVRTLAFVAGFGAQMTLAWQILKSV